MQPPTPAPLSARHAHHDHLLSDEEGLSHPPRQDVPGGLPGGGGDKAGPGPAFKKQERGHLSLRTKLGGGRLRAPRVPAGGAALLHTGARLVSPADMGEEHTAAPERFFQTQ